MLKIYGTILALFCFSAIGFAQAKASCADVPNHAALNAALKKSVGVGDPKANGGFALNMWATAVGRDGTVCAVTHTGTTWADQWLASRVISAQKANTSNSLSLKGLSLATANLYSLVQPGGSLYGLQFSNPVDPTVAYAGNSANFGKVNDPMVGKRIGGMNVFGGGLALYTKQGKLVGAIGVSGDTACADHNVAWKTRQALGLDNVPAGVNKKGDKSNDNIIYDITNGKSASGFGHPDCGLGEKAISDTF
jgi:uncharacterized protein GlcG (DUF336 family)